MKERTLFARAIIANTAESAIRVVCTFASASWRAIWWPSYLGAASDTTTCFQQAPDVASCKVLAARVELWMCLADLPYMLCITNCSGCTLPQGLMMCGGAPQGKAVWCS
eukprot:GHRR01030279.1.p1 GENE.GHRR01030279.1~~GHRR01030279.1.p1  ORF type:complete len:109 (-),score=18.90 GHRR01030279.1:517-843(-)